VETYYLVYMNGGLTSPNQPTLLDAFAWIEANVDADKFRHCTIKQQRRDRSKLLKEANSDMQKLEERMNRLQSRIKQLNGGAA